MSDGSADSPAGGDGAERGTKLKRLLEPSSACTEPLALTVGSACAQQKGRAPNPPAGVCCPHAAQAPPAPGGAPHQPRASRAASAAPVPASPPMAPPALIKGRAPAAAAHPQRPRLGAPWLPMGRVELPRSSPPAAEDTSSQDAALALSPNYSSEVLRAAGINQYK